MQLDIGKVLLTKSGQELARICGSKPVDGFYDYVKHHVDSDTCRKLKTVNRKNSGRDMRHQSSVKCRKQL